MTEKKPLSPSDKDFIRLILRSPDRGEGWRSVSKVCWPLVTGFSKPELIDVDQMGSCVRLTPEGEIVATYLT